MAVKPRSELLKEARAFQKQASNVTTAKEAVPETDPNEKGQVSAPNHPDGDNPVKTQIPSSKPTNTSEVPDGVTETSKTNPGPSGTDRKPTLDGDARDAAFTSPTTPLDKIAQQVRGPLENILKLSQANGGEATKRASVSIGESAPASEAAPEMTEELGAAMIKLSHALLSTERGMQVAEEYLAEYEGANQARELIEKAAGEHAAYVHYAAEQAELEKAASEAFEAEVAGMNELLKTASAEEIEQLQGLAKDHLDNQALLHPALHPFYKAGSEDAAMVVQAMMNGEEPGIPGGEGDLSPEQLEGLIVELVESGQIPPELAEQLLAALVGGEVGEMGGGEELPPEAAMAMSEGMPKAASLALHFINEL